MENSTHKYDRYCTDSCSDSNMTDTILTVAMTVI